MNLQGERLIPASVERTWTALNDPDTLKACIAGCESIERTEENQYLCTMAVRIGPVNARFKGKLQLTDIVPMESYRINFDGQGGVAGFGKGTADVSLKPEGDGTLLGYSAKAQVGGKLAQVGSRLIDAAASKIAEDFFAAFEARLAAPAQEASPGAQEASPDEAQETGPGQARQPVSPTHREPDAQDTGTIPGAAEAASDLGVESGTGIRDLSRPGRAGDPAEARGARASRAGSRPWLLWVVLAALILLLIVFVAR